MYNNRRPPSDSAGQFPSALLLILPCQAMHIDPGIRLALPVRTECTQILTFAATTFKKIAIWRPELIQCGAFDVNQSE
jgi:hypothetical protein